MATVADIFNTETDPNTPVLDYTEAARALAGVKHLGNDKLKTETVARVQAAALLDIAVTLNALLTGMTDDTVAEREVGPDGEPMGDEEREGDDPDDRDDFEAGDWVQLVPLLDIAANGAQLDVPAAKVLRVGVSEGSPWLELEHYDDDGSVLSSGVRAWAENYRRVPALPAAEVETADDGLTDDIDPRDLVDYLDDDFSESTTDLEPTKPAKVKSGKGKSKNKGGE